MSGQAGALSPDNLAQLLVRRFYWVDEALQKAIRAKGWPQVSRAQSLVFVNLGEGVRRPSDIAARVGVTRQAMHQTLAELVEMGFLRLVADPDDRRAKIVEHTELGARLGVDALAALRSIETELAARIGEESVAGLKVALQKDWGAVPDLG
jgi:DNA-binding MarR family transcriptional regulator